MVKQGYMHRQMTVEKPAIDPGVRVVRAFSTFSEGHILFPQGLYRDALIDKGYVVPVKPLEHVAPSEQPELAPAMATEGDA